MSRMGRLGHDLYTGKTSFDFVGRQRTWYLISAVILLVAVIALIFRGLNFGIEFRGGAEFRVPDAQCSVEEARAATGSARTPSSGTWSSTQTISFRSPGSSVDTKRPPNWMSR